MLPNPVVISLKCGLQSDQCSGDVCRIAGLRVTSSYSEMSRVERLTGAPLPLGWVAAERGSLMKATRMACARNDRCTCFSVNPAASAISSNVGCLHSTVL